MHPIDLEHSPISELEHAAADRMDAAGWAYYATGARDERTLRENDAAWDDWWWRPRRLTGAWDASIATTLLGRDVPHPIIVGPSALHGLAHADGELATARAVAALGGTMVLSTNSSVSVEEVARVPGLDLWFQLYPFEDEQQTRRLVRRARDAGARAIVLTVDVTSDADTAARPRGGSAVQGVQFAHHAGEPGLRHLTWAWADRLRDTCGMPVVLKGILHPEDSARAAAEGFAGIVVSNHGGRKLDGSMPTAFALPECVAAAAGRLEVFVDGGIRRGGHALVALALGARAVLVARPILWGLALDGEAGARTVLARLVRELAEDAALADIEDIRADPAGYPRAVGRCRRWIARSHAAGSGGRPVTQAPDLRVELQAEVDGQRDGRFPLVSSAEGLRLWLDDASLDARVGGSFRFRMLDGVAVGRVVALEPVQHVSYAWEWEAQPLGYPTTVAFDLIAHGSRTHLTLRHVGFRSRAQAQLHDAMWRHWFARLVAATRAG